MLTTRLRELLDLAIAGDVEANNTFQIEKLNRFAEVTQQTKERLSYFEALHGAIVDYFLQKPDISKCGSKFLHSIISAIYYKNCPREIAALKALLDEATLKCLDNPAACNVAGITMSVLFFRAYISHSMAFDDFHQLVLLQPDDTEGLISFLQVTVLTKTHANRERMLAKLQQSQDKNNPMAFFRKAEILCEGQDLTTLDKTNPVHKEIIRTLLRAISMGFPTAYYLLANIFLMQKTDDEAARAENTAKGIQYLMQGIDACSVECMYRLARLYFEIYPQDQNKIAEAILILDFAANKWGHVYSKLLLAKVHTLNEDKSIEEQRNKNAIALKLLNEVLAEKNCPAAHELRTKLLARIEALRVQTRAAKNKSAINDASSDTSTQLQPPQKRSKKTPVAQKAPRPAFANGPHPETTSVVIATLATAATNSHLLPVNSTQEASTSDPRQNESEFNGEVLREGNLLTDEAFQFFFPDQGSQLPSEARPWLALSNEIPLVVPEYRGLGDLDGDESIFRSLSPSNTYPSF